MLHYNATIEEEYQHQISSKGKELRNITKMLKSPLTILDPYEELNKIVCN